MFNSIKEHVFSIDRMRMMTRGCSRGCLKPHKIVCFQASMDLRGFCGPKIRYSEKWTLFLDCAGGTALINYISVTSNSIVINP